jgi:type I restriction enzyme S subunit
MDVSIITPAVLTEDRLDASYYGTRFLQNEAFLKKCGIPMVPVGTLTDKCNCGATPKDVVYDGNGTGLVRTTDVRSNVFLAEGVLRTSELRVNPDASVAAVPGDLLYTMSGTIGYAAVIHDGVDVVSFSNTIARARFAARTGQDSRFTAAFFNCKYGYTQSLRLVSGGIQGHVMPNPFKRLPVPTPAPEAQRYIGDKVRQAERLRERARRLDTLTFAAFDPLTQSLPSPQRAFRVPSSEVEAYRLNPNHFDPVVRAAIHAAKAVARLHPLSDLVIDGDIAGGATPLGAQYVADGIFFARVQNVKPLRLDRSDAAFITAEQDREIVRSRCRTDDVVLSITGYPGTASVVLDEDLPLNINQHSVRFAVRSEFGAGYVAAAINCRFGQLQVGRLAVGGTRDALDYTSVRSLLIPEFSSETREAINAQVRTANLCVRAAQSVVALAKLLVEHLIDGRLAEAELVAAQKALEAGDRSADREILKGLRQSDARDAKPLIADVDALYAILDGSEGQDA